MSKIQRFKPSAKGGVFPAQRLVAILIHSGFQVLSLSVSTVFEMANLAVGKDVYRIVLFSESGGLVRSSLGFSIQSERLPKRLPEADTIVSTGNNGFLPAGETVVRFLRNSAGLNRRIAATCTGAVSLAQAGLLDGRRATTHWYYADQLRREFPKVRVEEDRIFIEDGDIWTSAGMTAGIDLAIALVERDLGREIAQKVAKTMVVYHRRAGGQSQHSVMLDLTPKSDRIQSAVVYAKENLHKVRSVEDLAAAASLSLRQFNRLFRSETGTSPAKAVERLRIEAARLAMEAGKHSLDEIAEQTGFADRERMRRAFIRNMGVSPQAVRRATRSQLVSL